MICHVMCALSIKLGYTQSQLKMRNVIGGIFSLGSFQNAAVMAEITWSDVVGGYAALTIKNLFIGQNDRDLHSLF